VTVIAGADYVSTGPQGPAQPQDDCHIFADLVDQIYNRTIGTKTKPGMRDVQVFMNTLATTFTEFPGASLEAVTGLSQIEGITGNPIIPTFGSTGFRSEYFEADVVVNGRNIPMNQVRHAVGGLLAGYVGIPLHDPVLGFGMNDREDPNDPVHGVPDINLNGKTVPYGARLSTIGKGPSLAGPRVVGGVRAAKELGSWIRKTLCVP
jgi:hypothetical protein